MRIFRRVALASTIAVYLLIFVGGLVRVSGAGLGCPDWPKCFGRWIPPTNVSQLPADMDPNAFNFVLAWIEYFNRLVGVTVGLLLLATAILALIYYRKVSRILYPSLVALVLVAYQAWQGGQLVATKLEPIIVSAHLLIALVIVSILIYVTYSAYSLAYPATGKNTSYPRRLGLWMFLLWIVGLVQVVLGTQVRSAFELLEREMPQVSRLSLAASSAPVDYFHAFLGALIAVLTWYAGFRIFRTSSGMPPLVRGSVTAIMVLILLQIGIGAILILANLPSLMQLFHLWIASLYIGALFVLNLAIRQQKGGLNAV